MTVLGYPGEHPRLTLSSERNPYLPADTLEGAWINLPPPGKRSLWERRLTHAAQLYGMMAEPVIGGAKRWRVEKLFADALMLYGYCLISLPDKPTKADLFPVFTLARLDGQKLPAPLEYFQP